MTNRTTGFSTCLYDCEMLTSLTTIRIRHETVTDVHDLRKKNLKALVQQWEGPTNLAKKLGYQGPSYISQMVSGNRPITEKTARQIEDRAGLPPAWLDTVHTNGGAGRPAVVDTRLISRVVSTVGTSLEEAGVHLHPNKFAELVAMVYEEAAKTGHVDEQYVQRLINFVR